MLKNILLLCLFIPGIVLAEYRNTNGTALEKSFSDMLKWIRSDQEPIRQAIAISSDWKELNLLKDDNYAIWIGHSTFLIKKNGVTILTDPIFSERASPFKKIGPKRLIPPAIALHEIPKIDYVTVSHNHYDHLDINSLINISKEHPEAIFLVPAGDGKLLERKKINNVYEFDWWESFQDNDIELTFTPVQHWSKRGLFDRNKSLWGGWFVKFEDYSLYHAGDTGYSKDFIDTKLKLGSPKYAFIPIGAYDPEWFMAESHVNPEDAVQIMLDLEAEKGFGMHWATFTLTDEDTLEPRERLIKATNKFDDLNFISLLPGEIINLD
jgi:L-ascorbate metabolism protein UlaG (beta-lactamase superfamily)